MPAPDAMSDSISDRLSGSAFMYANPHFLCVASPLSLLTEIAEEIHFLSVTFLGRTKSASKPAFFANYGIESEFQCHGYEKVTQTTFFKISQILAFSREISPIRSALPSGVKTPSRNCDAVLTCLKIRCRGSRSFSACFGYSRTMCLGQARREDRRYEFVV